jgi:hypothetical protein
VSGAVVGGFANRLYMAKAVSATPNRAEIRKQYIQDMRGRLHLSDAQVAQLQTIADATGKRMREMHKNIQDDHVQQVTAILDDSQKAEYAKMREERERRRLEEAKKN